MFVEPENNSTIYTISCWNLDLAEISIIEMYCLSIYGICYNLTRVHSQIASA